MKTFYKVSATGAIQSWSIKGSLETQEIYIDYGQHNGAMQTQIHTVETNKSGRTLKEQMILEMKSRISKQKAKGYRVSIEEARKHINQNELNLHKPMLAQRYDKVRVDNYHHMFKQVKYDGHRCLVTNRHGTLVAYSRNGKVIDTLDHILQHIQIPEGVTIDGEIYHHGVPLQTIASWCKRKQPDTEKLIYVVYDVVHPAPYHQRLELLEAYCSDTKNVSIANTWRSTDDVTTELKQAIQDGYEGLILRSPTGGYDVGKRSKHLIKVKEVLDDEFKVIDVTPSKDGWGVLTCELPNGKSFNVSAPGTMENKRHILERKGEYIGKWIQVEFFSETKDGVPFHPVATIWRNKHDE